MCDLSACYLMPYRIAQTRGASITAFCSCTEFTVHGAPTAMVFDRPADGKDLALELFVATSKGTVLAFGLRIRRIMCLPQLLISVCHRVIKSMSYYL